MTPEREKEIVKQWVEFKCHSVEWHPLPQDWSVLMTHSDFMQMVDAVGELLQDRDAI